MNDKMLKIKQFILTIVGNQRSSRLNIFCDKIIESEFK